MSNQIEMTSYL